MFLPFWLYLVLSVVLKEKIHIKVIVGSIVASFGLLIIILTTTSNNQSGATILGDFMMLLSQLLTALSVTTAKLIIKNNKKIVAEQMVFYEYFIAGIISLTALVVFSDGLEINISFNAIIWLTAVIVFAGIVPIVLYYKAVKKLPGERIGDGTFISPIVGVIAAALFLDEPITVLFLVGASTIFFGLYISNNKIKPKQRPHYLNDFETNILTKLKYFEGEIIGEAKDFEKRVIKAAKNNF